jgi:DnaK suppressor protein
MNQEDQDRFKARLEELMRQLQANEATLKAAAQPVELDQTRIGRLSRTDVLHSRALALEAVRANTLKQERVIAALGRLETGTYGRCQTCEGSIDQERLEFDPAAALCITCARHASRR